MCKTNAQLSFTELHTLEICGQEYQEALVKLHKSSSYFMDMLTWDLPQVLTNGSNGKNSDRCLHPYFSYKLSLKATCKPLQHTQPRAQNCLGHPLGYASNKAEQGSQFFFLSHNASSSVGLILRIAGISSKYKKIRLLSSSNQHREMSRQQYKAI